MVSYWYCPNCKIELDGCHVTYEEKCEYCGSDVLSVPETISQEELDELIKAKADGRLVVLPCKAGDIVYTISGKDNNTKDADLSPEEAQELKAERDCWEREAQKWCSQLGEAKFLEVHGLITRYKCKIGDMVYEVNKNTNTISGYIITGINTYEYGHKNVFYKWELIEGFSTGKEGFYERELGKTVFLTKEETEALKGGMQ